MVPGYHLKTAILSLSSWFEVWTSHERQAASNFPAPVLSLTLYTINHPSLKQINWRSTQCYPADRALFWY
jgi:hypothetical protein